MSSACGADATVAERFSPHHGPSSTSHYLDLEQETSAMSAKKESYGDSVQIVKDAIEIGLVNNVVTKLQATTGTTEAITTRLDWTPACDELLQFYRTEIHPKVDPKRLSLGTDILNLQDSS